MDKTAPMDLRKCEIIELDSNSGYFITHDLIDSTNKKVTLSGKQRFNYKAYLVGDIIYTAKTIHGGWRLVTEIEFKRIKNLSRLKSEVDNYFDNK